jgi:hypothetical protein
VGQSIKYKGERRKLKGFGDGGLMLCKTDASKIFFAI